MNPLFLSLVCVLRAPKNLFVTTMSETSIYHGEGEGEGEGERERGGVLERLP